MAPYISTDKMSSSLHQLTNAEPIACIVQLEADLTNARQQITHLQNTSLVQGISTLRHENIELKGTAHMLEVQLLGATAQAG